MSPYLADDFNDDEVFHRDDSRSKSDESAPDTAWARICRGKTLGISKVFTLRSNIAPASSVQLNQPIDLLRIGSGNDSQALELCLTLAPPEWNPDVPAAALSTPQQIGGTLDNRELTRAGVAAIILGNPVAVIEWGVGGVSNKAEVDFLNGLTVNLTASFLRVTAFVEAAKEDAVHNQAYVVRACVGPGNPRATWNAQRTVMIGDIAAGTASATVATPRFAKRASVISNQPVPNQQLRYWRDAGGTTGAGIYSIAGGFDFFDIPIPGSAYFFDVNNLAVGGISNVSVVFELAI